MVVCLIPVLSIVQMNGWKEEIDIERETDRKTEREREREIERELSGQRLEHTVPGHSPVEEVVYEANTPPSSVSPHGPYRLQQ